VIVTMAPQGPRHAAVTTRGGEAIRRAIGTRALVREEKPLVLGPHSVPEPDICVVPSRADYYAEGHPQTALLVVESADFSLAQDRLTKAAIYAAASIPEYWIVNLRDDCVEVHRGPEPRRRIYTDRSVARRGDALTLVAFPDITLAVSDLLPPPDPCS
jgi:Uma2 family endonuclease